MLAAVLAALAIALASPMAAASGERAADRLAAVAAQTVDAASMTFDARVSIDAAGMESGGEIDARADLDTGDGEVVSRSGGYGARAIIDGDRFWFTSDEPEFRRLLPDGRRWVEGTFAEIGDSDVIAPVEAPALLYLLLGATDVSSEPGTNGATRYRFDLDLDAAAAAAPEGRRGEVRDLMRSSDGEISASGRAVVDDGHVSSMVAVGTVNGGEVRWEATFDDIGDAVTVDPPDDDRVVDLGEVPELRDEFFTAGT